jgi:hypothetical protein
LTPQGFVVLEGVFKGLKMREGRKLLTPARPVASRPSPKLGEGEDERSESGVRGLILSLSKGFTYFEDTLLYQIVNKIIDLAVRPANEFAGYQGDDTSLRRRPYLIQFLLQKYLVLI